MNRNIFIKKKIDEKSNPDVDYNYNKKLNERKDIIKPENFPFKPILNENMSNEKIKPEDLIIKINESKIDVNKEFNNRKKVREDFDNILRKKFNEKEKNNFMDQYQDKILKLKMLSIENDNFCQIKQKNSEFFDELQKKIENDKNELDELMKSFIV